MLEEDKVSVQARSRILNLILVLRNDSDSLLEQKVIVSYC